MREVAALAAVVALAWGVQGAPAPSREHAVEQYGKAIQCDGFLIEWTSETAQSLSGFEEGAWDLRNTPDGIAGYVRTRTLPDSCGEPVVCLEWGGESSSRCSLSTRPEACGAEAVRVAEDGWDVTEFAVPWETVQPADDGAYGVVLAVGSVCGAPARLQMSGNSNSPLSLVFTPRVKMQAAVVVLLLAAYVILYLRVRRRRSRRTG
jgi:hypothetical protein